MKRDSEHRLALRKRVLRNLDDANLEGAAGGFPDITTITIIPETITVTLTIILSSPCSNVYSKCGTCPPVTIA